jgi:molybdenum cofactor cytidylyltransferase
MKQPLLAAIVLAAGQSKRMGQPKMVLPWGGTTVIGQVVSTLARAGVTEIVVVTGGAGQEVQAALQGQPVRLVANPAYAEGEMLSSVQAGLMALAPDCPAALIVLGDQPQIEADVVEAILAEYHASGSQLIVPSYQMRRGHPWLVGRAFWPDLLALQQPERLKPLLPASDGAAKGQVGTLRDFLNAHTEQIHYLPVQTASVLQDLDTPQDYAHFRPKNP